MDGAGTHHRLPRLHRGKKPKATLGDASGLIRVTPNQEGPRGDPGSHHVAASRHPEHPWDTQTALDYPGTRRPTGQYLRPPWDTLGRL